MMVYFLLAPPSMKIMALKVVTATFVMAFLVLANAGASVLYQQNLDKTSFYAGGGAASENDTSPGGAGNFATAYDNFTLGSNSSVANVTWAGNYFNPSTMKGTITAWTVTFYANNSVGQPGDVLASYNMAGTANETFLETIGVSDIYTYSFDLSTAFDALAGTQYWLSVVPDQDPITPQWRWSSSTDGDGSSFQEFYNMPMTRDFDLTFTLNSAPSVPESGDTVLLLGSALLILGLIRGLGRRATLAA